MQKLHLLDQEIGTINDAELIINDFHWFLTTDEVAGTWTVKAGETVIFTADSRSAVDAFLYGMALAYKGLSPQLYAKLFSMMAGNIDADETPIEIELTDDDERLSDVNLQDYTPPPLNDDDDLFSFD